MQAAGDLRRIPFRREWYSLATTDPTAFYLYLANAAWLRSQVTKQDNDSESAKYFSICLNQVVERLGKETAKISPGLMLIMVGFACYDVCDLSSRGQDLTSLGFYTELLKTHLGHWDRRVLHLDALEKAVKLNGGLEGLDRTLSLIILW